MLPSASKQHSPDRETAVGVVLPVAISAIYWAGVAGIAPIQAVLATAGFAAISVIGYLALTFVGVGFQDSRARILTALGPGLAVGLFVLFVFRAIVSRQVFVWTYLLLVLLTLLLLIRRVFKVASGWISRGTFTLAINNIWRLPAAVAAVGIVLHREWWWNLPIVLAAYVSAITIRKCRKLKSRILALLSSLSIVTISTMWGASLRSESWWVSSSNDDDPFFEAWSHSLIEWGPFVDPLVASGNGPKAAAYHHLVYFLVGLIDYVADAATFLALSRIVPVLLAASACFSFLLLLSVIRQASRAIVFTAETDLLVASIFFVGVTVTHPLSDFLASGLLIGTLALAGRGVPTRALPFTALSVLTIGASMFSKTAYAYAAVLILCVLTLRQSRSWWRALVPAVIGLAYVAAFSVASVNASMFSFEFFSENAVGEHAFGGVIHKLIAIVFVITPISFSLAALLEVARYSRISLRVRDLLFAALSVLIVGLLLRVFLGVATARLSSYFVRPAYLMSTVIVTITVLNLSSEKYRRSGLLVMGAVCVAISFLWTSVIPEVIPNLSEGSAYAKIFRLFRDPQILGLVSLAIAIGWPYLLKGRLRSLLKLERRFVQQVFVTLVLPALVISVGLLSVLDRVEERRAETVSGSEDEVNAKVLGGNSLREVSLQLKRLSRADDLVAYTICDFTQQDQTCNSPNLIAAYSDRRFLHLYGTSDFWGFSSPAEAKDFQMSAQLLEMSASYAVSQLQKRGVSFVILDLPRTSPQWIAQAKYAGARIVFENEDFLLLAVSGT